MNATGFGKIVVGFGACDGCVLMLGVAVGDISLGSGRGWRGKVRTRLGKCSKGCYTSFVSFCFMIN